MSDCELAADQWVVNDPSKPHCPHTRVTTQSPAVTPPGASTTSRKDCASPLCELIRDRCPCRPLASGGVRVSGSGGLSCGTPVCKEELRPWAEHGAGTSRAVRVPWAGTGRRAQDWGVSRLRG